LSRSYGVRTAHQSQPLPHPSPTNFHPHASQPTRVVTVYLGDSGDA
jgi:hypothetical protein